MRYFLTIANGGNEKLDFAYGYISETVDQCKEIVQEVAKEYGKDTNVPSNGWIPCSERLPEKYVDVLVTVKHFEYPQMGHLEGGVWYADDTIKYLPDAVIAWQPLPAPYQKGE